MTDRSIGWSKRFKQFLRWLSEPAVPPCPRCKRPLASGITDSVMWKIHHDTPGANHLVVACDGTEQCGTITVGCRYDGYSEWGDWDW